MPIKKRKNREYKPRTEWLRMRLSRLEPAYRKSGDEYSTEAVVGVAVNPRKMRVRVGGPKRFEKTIRELVEEIGLNVEKEVDDATRIRIEGLGRMDRVVNAAKRMQFSVDAVRVLGRLMS